MSTRRKSFIVESFIVVSLFAIALAGCVGPADDGGVITLWHQMTPSERSVLNKSIEKFEQANPGVRIRALYKETEELRSGFQSASITPTCPELVYGPSDVMGPFQEMGVVQDMSPWFSDEEIAEFVPQAVTYLPKRQVNSASAPSAAGPATALDLVQIGDRIGNHLALVYNTDMIPEPPKTTDELVQLAVANTIDADGNNTKERYGLVWNFKEPFFIVPFITGYGGWLFDADNPVQPDLDTPENVAAFNFIKRLLDEHRVVPPNCDYENADAAFKSGEAAMIINGDWSWADYLNSTTINAAVAPLPTVSETGIPMGPMVSPKGFSLSATAKGEAAENAMRFVRFMTSVETQRLNMRELKTLPSRKALLDDPLIASDATLAASAQQMQNGRAMPVVSELRSVWDSMKPEYQALLGGSVSAEQAAASMQSKAISTIAEMNEDIQSGPFAATIKWIGVACLLGLLFWQRHSFAEFARDCRGNWLAYAMALPALLVIFLTIVYPFVYNIVLSFSNMSLRHFQDWEIVGFQNYAKVLADDAFWPVLLKTLIWTVVNVGFHVALGLLLAVLLNGPVRGKSIYRVLLILPWAVPAYITALTWRGMFDPQYGAVNLLSSKFLSMSPIDWLGDPLNAFIACITTNVWLGFPFMMVIALGGMQGIPQELYEAARIDRVSRWKQFWHITLPMLKPVLLPAATLGAVWTFNNLNVIWLVSNGGEPSDKTHILVSYVYKAVFNLYRYGYGAALSMVIFLILFIFCVAFLWRAEATEGV